MYKEGINKSSYSPEAKEHEPTVYFDFFFAPHRTKEDAEGLEKAIQHADVIALERVAWNPEEEALYNRISDGTISRDELNDLLPNSEVTEDNALERYELELLSESNKPIVCADIPNAGPEAEAYTELKKRAKELSKQAHRAFLEGDLPGSIQARKMEAELFFEAKNLREEYTRTHLPQRIKDVIRAHTELQKKTELHVACIFGPAHDTLIQRFQADGQETTTTRSSFIGFGTFEEIIKRKFFGKEVPEIYYARLVLEGLFRPFAMKATKYTAKAVYATRKNLEKLTMEDYDAIAREAGKEEGEHKKLVNIWAYIGQKGMIAPDLPEELDVITRPLGKRNWPAESDVKN